MLRTCVLTVFTETDSSLAISGLDRFVGRYRSTLSSVGLSSSTSGGGRPVAASDIPGEKMSPTQPFPNKPEPLARLNFTMADIATVTPQLEAACRKLIACSGAYWRRASMDGCC